MRWNWDIINMKATMLLDGPIYQMYLYCIYYNRFVQNTGHLQRDAEIIRRVGTLEFSE